MFKNIMITAHSGCDDFEMNSKEYLSHARELAIIDALEIDVRKDFDGKLILTHNPPEREKKYISLREAFEILKGSNVKINCDLKERGLESEIINLAALSKINLERIIFTGSLTDWREKFSGVKIWVNPEEISPDFYAAKLDHESAVISAAKYNHEAINIDYNFLDEKIITAAKNFDVSLSLWTIDDPKELPENIFTSRIINITTNYPQKIFDALKAKIRLQ